MRLEFKRDSYINPYLEASHNIVLSYMEPIHENFIKTMWKKIKELFSKFVAWIKKLFSNATSFFKKENKSTRDIVLAEVNVHIAIMEACSIFMISDIINEDGTEKPISDSFKNRLAKVQDNKNRERVKNEVIKVMQYLLNQGKPYTYIPARSDDIYISVDVSKTDIIDSYQGEGAFKLNELFAINYAPNGLKAEPVTDLLNEIEKYVIGVKNILESSMDYKTGFNDTKALETRDLEEGLIGYVNNMEDKNYLAQYKEQMYMISPDRLKWYPHDKDRITKFFDKLETNMNTLNTSVKEKVEGVSKLVNSIREDTIAQQSNESQVMIQRAQSVMQRSINATNMVINLMLDLFKTTLGKIKQISHVMSGLTRKIS